VLQRLKTLLATQFLLVFAFVMAAPGAAYAQAVSGQGTWETTLLGRDINLNSVAATSASAVYLYDTTLNVTWLRDANANVGNGGGYMDFATATNWAANLVTGSGATAINDWRLPTMADPAAACPVVGFNGPNCGYNPATSSSELASLFFSTLGNKPMYDTSGNFQAGYGLMNAGSFQNMVKFTLYWLGTDYAPNTDLAWQFNVWDGVQTTSAKSNQWLAMAVHNGDVLAAVPEPETYAMLLAGLGLIGGLVARRRRP
jgi:hypothetical protein